MEHIKAAADNFTREIRSVSLCPANTFNFTQNLRGDIPEHEIITFEVIPEEFQRKVQRRKQDGNYYFDIEISFPVLDLSTARRNSLSGTVVSRDLCAILTSNADQIAVGNNREPLTVEVMDDIRDDASGKDQLTLVISGTTIIEPKVLNL